MLLLVVLIFFEVFIFIFLIFLLRRVLSRNITSATEHLDVLTQDYMKKQEAAQKKLDEAKDIYQKKIDEAKEEAEKIRLAAQREVNSEKEKIINKARLESDEIVKQAQKARDNLILDIENKIKNKAMEKAPDLLGRTLNKDLRFLIHEHIIKEFVDEDIDGINNIGSGIGDVHEAKITSAFDIGDSIKESISSKIRGKTVKDIVFSNDTDESLIAGLIITIGALVIDASLRWKIKEKAKDIINEI